MDFTSLERKMLSIFLTVAAILATFDRAVAGGVAGGGGAAMICRNRNGIIKSVEMLDLLENPYWGYKNTRDTVLGLINKALDKVERNFPDGKQRRQVITAAINTVGFKSYFLDDDAMIAVPNDAQAEGEPLVITEGCEPGAVGYFTKEGDSFGQGGNLRISKKAFGYLNTINRAAFLLHEGIYYAHRRMIDSLNRSLKNREPLRYDIKAVRRLVSLLLSEQTGFSRLTDSEKNIYYTIDGAIPVVNELGRSVTLSLSLAELKKASVDVESGVVSDIALVLFRDPAQGLVHENIYVTMPSLYKDDLNFSVYNPKPMSPDEIVLGPFREARLFHRLFVDGNLQYEPIVLRQGVRVNVSTQYGEEPSELLGNLLVTSQDVASSFSKDGISLFFHDTFSYDMNHLLVKNNVWGYEKPLSTPDMTTDVRIQCRLEVKTTQGEVRKSPYESLGFVMGDYGYDELHLSLTGYYARLTVVAGQKDLKSRKYVVEISAEVLKPDGALDYMRNDTSTFAIYKPSEFYTPDFTSYTGDHVRVKCKTDGKVFKNNN